MELADIISPRSIFLSVEAGSVKRVLQLMAEQASVLTGLNPRLLMDELIAREKLGSTSLGAGVSIPHARYAGLDQVHAIFMRLTYPVDVAASDGRAADLFLGLLAPADKQSDHARILSRAMRLLSDEITCDTLRKSPSVQEVHAILSSEDVVA